MNNRMPRSTLLCSSFVLSLSVAGCDDGIGVYSVLLRTAPDGEPEFQGGACEYLSDDTMGEAGGGGLDHAVEMATKNGKVVHRYFIAPEGAMLDVVTSANGELAAQVEGDMEFFASGETKHITFETYEGVLFDVFLWGEPNCEAELPLGPPPGWE